MLKLDKRFERAGSRIAFALGGGAAEEAGKFGMKIGGNVAASTIRKTVRKDLLKALQSIGGK